MTFLIDFLLIVCLPLECKSYACQTLTAKNRSTRLIHKLINGGHSRRDTPTSKSRLACQSRPSVRASRSRSPTPNPHQPCRSWPQKSNCCSCSCTPHPMGGSKKTASLDQWSPGDHVDEAAVHCRACLLHEWGSQSCHSQALVLLVPRERPPELVDSQPTEQGKAFISRHRGQNSKHSSCSLVAGGRRCGRRSRK